MPSFTLQSKAGSGRLFVAGMLVFGLCNRTAFAEPNDLRSRLERLAAESSFAIGGLEWIGPEAARDERGSVPDRLNALLRDYNYVLIHDGRGGIEKVLITSHKTPEARSSAGSATVYTVRVGNCHQVEAAIAGPNGIVRTVRLMVDTGATSLVLPASMILELGFAPEALRAGMGMTINGPVPSVVGMLDSVRVGAVSADNVRVSFIADERLHGAMLLGMSFLQRFRMTIDDERNELVLLTK
jgi:aspartyl protease family protein